MTEVLIYNEDELEICKFLENLGAKGSVNRNGWTLSIEENQVAHSITFYILKTKNAKKQKIYMSRLKKELLRRGVYHEMEECLALVTKEQRRKILFNLDLFA